MISSSAAHAGAAMIADMAALKKSASPLIILSFTA
jgi:hypothetical protein